MMHDGEKDVFFFSVFMGSYTSGLAVFGDARGTSPSYSIPIGAAPLFYSIRFRKWSFLLRHSRYVDLNLR